MSVEKISYFPDESIVTIELSGAFYRRLQSLLFSLTEGVETEDVQKIYRNAVEDKIEKPIDFNVQTLLYLCKEIETKITDQNLWVEEEFKLDDNA